MDSMAKELEMFQAIEGEQESTDNKNRRDEQTYTTDYIDALPEGTRVELINGRIYDMAAPSLAHQLIQLELGRKIADYIDEKGEPCKVVPAPFGVYLTNDKKTFVKPDISVICDPSKLDNKGCHGAPDWIIEVVSPSNFQMDYMRKQFKYERAGVREYWIVDLERDTVWKYDYENSEIGEYKLADTVPVGIYPDFAIDFREIMARI